MNELELSTTKTVQIIKHKNGVHQVEDEVAVEFELSIYLNGRFFIRLLCTPEHLDELIYGYLFSEGVITTKDDLISMELDPKQAKVQVQIAREDLFTYLGDQLVAQTTVTTACGKGRKVTFPVVREGSEEKINPIPLEVENVVALVRQFNKSSDLFLRTGGVHSCALGTGTEILYTRDDVGRHNALEKVLGRALMDGLDLSDKVILTTGRMSSEIVEKVILRGIPALISRSAPTDRAVTRAIEAGLTLIGFVRGDKMNVYSQGTSGQQPTVK